MAGYCLPPEEVDRFKAAMAAGHLDVFQLQDMSSADRRSTIAQYIGDEHASEVNAAFEQKLLLRYKFGLFEWAKQVTTDLSDSQRKTILDKINNLDDRILNPSDEKSFLADLAAEKVGTRVTSEQAKEIFDLSQKAEKLKGEWQKNLDQNVSRSDVNNPVYQQRLQYGNALLDLKDYVESLKPDGRTWANTALNLLTMPKTVATGILHFSAIGVQAWGMISKKVTWEAFGQQFRYFADESNYRDLQAYIVSHPDYKYAAAGKLGLTDVSDTLNAREEAIQSSFLQDLNTHVAEKSGLPINVLGASSRAFTGFLNYTRFNRFVDLLEASRKTDGEFSAVDDQRVKDLASVVNNFTGRGNLGPDDRFANAQSVLNTTFFAPRKMVATFQMFSPIEYSRLTKNAVQSGDYTALRAATGQLTGSIIATGSLLYLANSMGYKVDYNPESADFLKIQTPSGEKLDVTGGNAIYTRLWGRILTGKEVTASGKEVTLGQDVSVTRADLVSSYLRGKLSPVAGALVDALYGKDMAGRTFDLKDEAEDRMEPIVMENLLNYYNNQPDKAVSDIPVLSGIFGVSVESPMPPPMKFGMNAWGTNDPHVQEFDKELAKTGYVQHFPSQTINGVKLTDDQYKSYIQLTGGFAQARIQSMTQSQGWGDLSQKQQLKILKGVNRSAQNTAGAYVMAQSVNSPNDIVRQSLDKAKADAQ